MKTLFLLLIAAIVLTLFIYSPIEAQQVSPVETPVVEAPPPLEELPDAASGLLGYVETWLLFVSGLLATHIMNLVKTIPGLGKQEKFMKLITELVSGVTASVLAFLLGNAAIALGFLDESGLWQVVLYAWPAAVGIYHGKKLSKGVTG